MKLGTLSWRIVVGWPLMIFGGTIGVIASLSVVVYGFSLVFTPTRPLYRGPLDATVAGCFLQFVAGILWWWSGYQIRRKGGWWPLLGIALGYGCGVGGAMLLGSSWS